MKNLPESDAFTLALLTNDAVLAVDQNSHGAGSTSSSLRIGTRSARPKNRRTT